MRLVYLFLSVLLFSFTLKAQQLSKGFPLGSTISQDSLLFPIDSLAGSILLKEVTINGFRNYKQDSLNLRKDFARAFQYKPPGIKDIFIPKAAAFNSTPTPYYKAQNSTASIVSLDVLSLIGFLGRKKASLSKTQKTLLERENANYVNQFFSKEKVQGVTGLKGDSLQHFMQQYRPTTAQINKMTDYELLMYIKKSCQEYRGSK